MRSFVRLAVALLAYVLSLGTVRADDWKTCAGENQSQAVAACGRLIADKSLSNTNRAYVFNNRGVALKAAGRYDRAIADYDQAIRLKPDYATAFNNRGAAYKAKGDLDRAIADYSRAIRLKSDYAAAYYNRGSAYDDKSEYDRAIADYDQAIRLKPDYAFAFFNRAVSYRKKGENDRAIADYDRVIGLTPDDPDAFVNRGNIYKAKAEYDRAIADYDAAIRLKPDYASAFNSRGTAYGAKGEYDRAIADYDEAIRLKPDYASAFFNRGSTYDDKDEYDRAIADYDEAIRLRPNYADAFINRGVTRRKKGEPDRAIADYDEAIRLTPDDAVAFNNRGIAYEAKGNLDHAIADYDEAIRLKPDYKRAIDNRTLAVAARSRQAGAKPESQGAGPAERRVALVIGNSTYRGAAQLPNPARDAVLVADALRRRGIEVTVLHDLGRSEMIEALNTFAQAAQAADWAIIYFAGHGMELGGTNYLIPTDARLASETSLSDEAITLQRMLSASEGARKLRLVILDACRNNPFAAQMKLTEARRSGLSRGLARIEPNKATLVVYAAKEGTTAADGQGDNSPFAVAFARRLAEPGVEINKVFRFVTQDVKLATNNEQVPATYGDLPPEDFFFGPGQ